MRPILTSRWRFAALALLLPMASMAGTRAAAQYSAPVLDLSPHSGNLRMPSPFDATLSYTTPAYVSRDEPRSVTLVYSAERTRPTGFVVVDATDRSSVPPERMSIRVLGLGSGAPVAQTNGLTETFYRSGSGTTRLAAQWDLSMAATQVAGYEVSVTSYWADGTTREARQFFAMPFVNERESPFGSGWSIAGLQRLYVQGDGALLVVEGGGAATRFTPGSWTPECGCQYRSPEGDFTTLTYDAVAARYTRSYPDGTRWVFEGSGDPLYAEDRFGNRTSFGYYTIGAGSTQVKRLRYIQDPAGKLITFGYYENQGQTYSWSGQLDWIEDPAGRRTDLEPSGTDKALLEIRDPDGVLALRLYVDSQARVVRYRERTLTPPAYGTDPADSTWSLHYDAAGALAGVEAPLVTADNQLVRPLHWFTSWELALLAPAGTGSAASPAPRVTPEGVRASLYDPRGNVTRLLLDRWMLPARIEAPLGHTTVVARNAAGQDTLVSGPSGHQVRTTWSGAVPTWVEDLVTAQVVNYRYGVFAQLDSVWGDTEPVRHYLNARGLPDSTRIGNRAKTLRYSFDARGRLLSQTDPEGHGTFYRYGDQTGTNPWANLDTVSTGSTSSTYRRRTSLRYDGYGRVQTVRDPAGDTTRTEYDALNRVTRTVAADGATTRYYHGAAGLDSLIDARSQVYRFRSNALGWLEQETDPRGQTTHHAYDRGGLRSTFTNRRGQTVGFTYDALGRPLTRTADGRATTYAYDNPGGRWAAASNEEGTDTLRFDAAGRATHEIGVHGGFRTMLESELNREGLRTRLRATGPWGSDSIGFGYDTRRQLERLTDLAGGVTTLGYDQDGLLTSVQLPNAASLTQGYVSTHRRASTEYSDFSLQAEFWRAYEQTTQAQLGKRHYPGGLYRSFRYDKARRVLGFTDYQTPDGTGCQGSYRIDPDTGARCTTTGIPQVLGGETYTYDALGNRTDRGAVVETGNRLTQFSGDTLQYDADGNLTRKAGNGTAQVLTWDALGRLTSVTSGATTLSYGYDGWERRIRRTSTDGSVQRYLYDGDDLLMELSGTGQPLQRYTMYPGTDRPHSVRHAGGVSYYATDASGNVIGLFGADRLAQGSYEYTPFGQQTLGQDQRIGSLFFHARELDRGTGLYYFRARWYDPELARFVSEDPLGLEGGLNLYAFAGNDPVNRRDPWGEECPPGHVGVIITVARANNQPDGIIFWCAKVVGDGGGGDPAPPSAGSPGGAGGMSGPRGGGGSKATVSRRTAPIQRAPKWQSAECVAAGAAAAVAVVEDLSVLAGAGLALKGVQGARMAVRLTAVGERFAYQRFGVPLPGQIVNSRYMLGLTGNYALGIVWGGSTSSIAGQEYGFAQWLGGFVPGYNSWNAYTSARDACTH